MYTNAGPRNVLNLRAIMPEEEADASIDVSAVLAMTSAVWSARFPFSKVSTLWHRAGGHPGRRQKESPGTLAGAVFPRRTDKASRSAAAAYANSAATLSKYSTHLAISGREFFQLYSYSMENTPLNFWR